MNFYRLKSIFFIIFSCFILQTAAFAQNNVKITIKKKNITLQEALREVEKQSDYLIAFNESKLEKTKRVNLNINAESLDKTLASDPVRNGAFLQNQRQIYHDYSAIKSGSRKQKTVGDSER